MSIPTTILRVIGTGNGSATSFSFSPIVAYEDTEIVVTHVATNGVETPLTIGTGAANYSVTFTDPTNPQGSTGSVTYPADEVTPMAAGEFIFIERVLELKQEAEIQNRKPFFPNTVETALDKLLLISQQQQYLLDRMPRNPVSDELPVTGMTEPLASLRGGRVRAWDGAGRPAVGPSSDALTSIVAGSSDLSLQTAVVLDTIAGMTALASSGLVDGHVVLVLGYSAALDGGGGVFRWNAASTATVDNGLVFEADDMPATGRWLRNLPDTVSAKAFGATGDGVTDDSSAIDAALSASTQVYFPPGSYLIESTVTVDLANAHILGFGDVEIVTDGNDGVTQGADNLRISGIEFRSLQTASATPDIFVNSLDVSGLEIDYCPIGRGRIVHRSTASTTESNLNIRNCRFTGDFTGASSSDVANVIDIRGIESVHICNNKFTCIEWYRVIKISSATGDTSPYDTGRSKRIIVTDNEFDVSASNGQQLMDLFASSEEIRVANNEFTCAGSFSYVIYSKPGATATRAPHVDNISVVGNTFKLASGVDAPIFIAGAWGLAWFSVINKCLVSNNIIEEAGTSTSAAIDVRGMNYAVITNNVREAPSIAFSRFINAANNQCLTIDANQASFGFIDVIGNGQTPGGDSYGNQPESIIITGNTIDDFIAQAAVHVHDMTSCEEITVSGNHFRNQTDSASIIGAVRLATVTVSRLNIADNTANFDDTAKHKVALAVATITSRRERGNNWNVATSTWNPASLGDGAGETSAGVTLTGAAFGDTVRVAAPYDLQGITLTAYVSAADTVKGRLQNETGGTIDLASGSYTWSLEKQS